MTSRQADHLSMLERVKTFIEKNGSELEANPVIAEIAVTLANNLNVIRDLKQVQDRKTKDASRKKDEIKFSVIDGILKIGAALKAHATEANDFKLLALANFTDSTIRRMRHTDLAEKARMIYEAAEPLDGELGIYLVKKEDVHCLKNNLPHYLQALPVRHCIRMETKQATTEIKGAVNTGLKLVKQKLDVHMRPYKSVSASLYGEYLNSRRIVNVTEKHAVRAPGLESKSSGSVSAEVWSLD
jgi:hypothetical protein